MAQDNERDGFFTKDNLAPEDIQSAVALTASFRNRRVDSNRETRPKF